MLRISHQTVRLGRGDHPNPTAGMCVLELASVLAGEEFSAYPTSVCPVIAAFLRCYNDIVDDSRRQDLIGCASAVVGSRETERVETRRARLCRRWVVEVAHPGLWAHPFWALLAVRRLSRNVASATYAAFVALEGDHHHAALNLVGRLLGESDAPASLPAEPTQMLRRARARTREMQVSR